MKHSNGDELISAAIRVIEKRFVRRKHQIQLQSDAANYFRLKFANLDHEEFAVLFLNSQNEVLASEVMFRGTINQTAVYLREICRTALRHNASAVLLAHNHPSGHHAPSQSDIVLTEAIVNSLGVFDIRVLDHVVVSNTGSTSLRDAGMMYKSEDTVITRKPRRKKRKKKAACLT